MTGNDTTRIAQPCVDSNSKYTVDPSMFDALVESATELSVNDKARLDIDTSRSLKTRLLEMTDSDIEYLIDTINCRIDQGQGETILEFGVNEDGGSMGLTSTDIETISTSLDTITSHATVGGFSRLLFDSGSPHPETPEDSTFARSIGSPKKNTGARVAYFLLRRQPNDVSSMLEVRVAVVGNVDAGKSTILGVLTRGHLDDGRGKARVSLFRHKHEVESGRTSSVGMEVLGFDKRTGSVIRSSPTSDHRGLKWDEICMRASKLISFIDLAGHEKYLKTTVFGIAGGSPSFVMLMVAANAGLVGMAKEHLGLALALSIPVFVVITKIDMCPPRVLDSTLKQLSKVLRSSGCRKVPIAVRSLSAAVSTAGRFVGERICPVFQVSNVTGEGVDLLTTFLNLLPIAPHPAPQCGFMFEINETFTVPFVGTVVSGVVSTGTVRIGDSVWFGPDSLGKFRTATIKGIQRKRVDVECASAGQSASFALKKINRAHVRKGMVLLEKTQSTAKKHEIEPVVASRTFLAEVLVLYHSTTIAKRYQAMVHCGSVRQTARILEIDHAESLRTGDRANVVFQFIRTPEFLLPGSRLIFREGRTKGIGKVVAVFDRAQEIEAVSRATNGTMVLDPREFKAHKEAVRHNTVVPNALHQTHYESKVATKS